MNSTALAAFEPSVPVGLVASYPETRIGAFDFYVATCTEPLWCGSADAQRACGASWPGVTEDLFLFIQEDPLRRNTRKTSLYGYAAASPVLLVDPTGLVEMPPLDPSKGHHVVPRGVWGKIADLSDDAVDVFDHALTGGPLPRGLHSWDGPTGVHGRYNEAVAELFDDFLKQKGLTPGQVSRLEAEEFVQVVLKSRKAQVWRLLRPIRGFLRGANFKGRLFCVDPFSVGIGLVELLFQDEAEAKQDFDYQLWRMGFGPEPGAVVPGV